MSIFEDCEHYDEADEAAAQMALLTRELWPDLLVEDSERTPPPM